jgi:hypothetical protein
MPERLGRIKFSRASKYVIRASHCCGFGQAVDDNFCPTLLKSDETRSAKGKEDKGIGGK